MRNWLRAGRRGFRERFVKALGRAISEANERAVMLPTYVEPEHLIAAAKAKSAGRDVLVHFVGQPVNLYQLRTWLRPLSALNDRHRVLLATQSQRSFSVLTQLTELPVVSVPTAGELEVLVNAADFKVCFYVSHHSGNFKSMRHAEMFHVNIGHGESDKLYMASNQAKAYDYMYVAGDAAVDRYQRNLINFDLDRLIKIGRPQLDSAEPCLAPSGRPTVIYAPTWEGDRPTMAYTSVTTYGERILAELLKPSSGLRVVFRPHPFVGTHDTRAKEALGRMRAMVTEAARTDPGVGHLENLKDEFTSLALSADVLVADNSAVLLDFLATGNPVFVTSPEVPEALLPEDGVCAVAYRVDRDSVSTLVERIGQALAVDELCEPRQRLLEHYYGDVTPGRSTERFIEATTELIERRNALVEAKQKRLVP